MYICAGAALARTPKRALRDALGSPPKSKKQPTQAAIAPRGRATAHRASKPRTEPARSEKPASNAQANETRVTGGKTEHKQNTPAATKMPSNIPVAPKSQYEIERDERIKRNEAFMLSIGIDPHGGGYVLSSA